MNRIFYSAVLIFLMGCVSATQDTMTVNMEGMPRRFISLRQVRQGMNRQEVSAVLDKDIITGYDIDAADPSQYKPIIIKNPNRSEAIQKGLVRYDVVYYLQGIKTSDGQVTDDELVPLVFENNRLIGMGWDFLNGKINPRAQEHP